MDTGLVGAFLENRAALRRFLCARGAEDGVEDLLQELWAKASAATSQPVADPVAYLYRAANNLLLDKRRAELRRQRRERDWISATYDPTGASDLDSGERRAVARDQLRLAEAALSALGERTETVFRRFRLEGASQRQIADDLGISLSAVEKHLQRAYRALIDLRRKLDAE